MSSEFNPYLQWLGIRETQRPIHHYRLLGLEPFEADANVISMAADRQMAHLRTFQTGRHGELVQQLLNEISAAKICLLKPERKAAYDLQLRKKLATPRAPAQVTVVSQVPSLGNNFPGVITSTPAELKLPVRQKSNRAWVILTGLVVLCGVMIAILINKHQPEPEVASNENQTKTSTTVSTTNSDAKLITPKTPPANQKQDSAKDNTPVTKGVASPTKKPSALKQETPATNTTTSTPKSATPPGHDAEKANRIRNISEKIVAQGVAQATFALGEELPKKVDVVDPVEPVSPVSPPSKAPAHPDKAAVVAKAKEIREIFKDEYASKNPEERIALTKKLLKSAQEQKDDRLTKLVLLQEARDLALQVGEAEVALSSVKQLSVEFNEDLGEASVAMFSKLIALPGRQATYYQSLLSPISKAILELQDLDDYDSALRLANMAQALARRVNDAPSVTRSTAVIKELSLLKGLFAKARTARETLQQNPQDAAANQTWGEFLCFAKNDFDKGLKHLKNGTDADLQELAKRDLANPEKTEEILALADAWWTAAEGAKDRARSLMRERALTHYQKLMGKISGLAGTKVEKRIKEISAEISASGRDPDAEWRKWLLATPWSISWQKPRYYIDVITFKEDGTCHGPPWIVWELNKGELVLRNTLTKEPNTAYVKIRYTNNQFQAEYIDPVRTMSGVVVPNNPK
jgi:hypothetical protein